MTDAQQSPTAGGAARVKRRGRPVLLRATGPVLAAALATAGTFAAAGPAAADPTSPVRSLARTGIAAPLAASDAASAADVRILITVFLQTHTALNEMTQSAYLRKGARLGAAAAAVDAQFRGVLADLLGTTAASTGAFRSALAHSDAAKLAYARGVDRYSGRRSAALRAARAVTRARAGVVATLSPLVPTVPRVTLTSLLAQQDAREAAATRALGARSTRTYALAERAHLSTTTLARTVAVALDQREGLAGTATSREAGLRARMVNLGIAHVVQTGMASDAGLTYGLFSGQYRGAAAALHTNTEALTAEVRRLSGTANASRFRAQWQRHIRDYARDTAGIIDSRPSVRSRARRDLRAFAVATAPVLNRLSGLPRAQLRTQLRVHVTVTLEVIRLQAARSPQQFFFTALGAFHFAALSDELAMGAVRRTG